METPSHVLKSSGDDGTDGSDDTAGDNMKRCRLCQAENARKVLRGGQGDWSWRGWAGDGRGGCFLPLPGREQAHPRRRVPIRAVPVAGERLTVKLKGMDGLRGSLPGAAIFRLTTGRPSRYVRNLRSSRPFSAREDHASMRAARDRKGGMSPQGVRLKPLRGREGRRGWLGGRLEVSNG